MHTNLLATLGNLSGSFKHLNPYACQQIVVLFEKLAKRFTKALSAVNSIQSTAGANGVVAEANHAASGTGSDRASEADAAEIADYSQNLSIYEEVLRMILEIINSCLASQLVNNPDLIYTLLYKRHIFEPFQSNPSFQDVISNIELVLSYFSNLIPSDRPENPPSVDEVKEIIQVASKKWPSEKLKVKCCVDSDTFLSLSLSSHCNQRFDILSLLVSSFRTFHLSNSNMLRMINRKNFSFLTFGLLCIDRPLFTSLRRIFSSSIPIVISFSVCMYYCNEKSMSSNQQSTLLERKSLQL